MTQQFIPVIISACADCGVGTNTLGENYMVTRDIWEHAWAGRRKPWHGKVPGQEILCIGCLEERIGRTLMKCDFTDCLLNTDPDQPRSERLRNRLTTSQGILKGGFDGLMEWMVAGMVKKLPEHQREAALQSWRERKHDRPPMSSPHSIGIKKGRAE